MWEHSPDAASYRIVLRHPGALSYNLTESFPWTGNSVDWNGFNPAIFAGVVVIAVGLLVVAATPWIRRQMEGVH